jgi:adenylylsulfate kinase
MITLVCGLPGSGKTTWCERYKSRCAECYDINVAHINADKVREAHCDWDFSEDGRLRQASRMGVIARECLRRGVDHVLVDMVAPTRLSRSLVGANHIIFMDTIKEGRYEDTNAIFVPPTEEEAESFERIYSWTTGFGGGVGGAS